MEAQDQTKNTKDMNNMDKRLDAIKEIIVGNNFEKIEAKIGKVTQNLERTNARVLKVVEQLGSELQSIKNGLDQKIERTDKKSFEDDEEIRDALFTLKQDTKEYIEKLQDEDESLRSEQQESERDLQTSQQMLETDLLKEIENLRDGAEEQARRLENLEQASTVQAGKISALEDQVTRIDSLEDTLQAIREDFSNGLQDLTEEVRGLKRADERLFESISEEVDDRKTDMDQLETRVANSHGEIKAYLSERSRVFANRQQKLEDRMEGLDDRLIGLHDLLEDEVFKYFEDLKKHKKKNREQLKALQQEFYNQLDDTMIRLEGRIDGMADSNRKEIRKLDKKFKNKDTLKRTLGRLGDLLDD
jgi:chromosome segregation ATPase